MWSDNEADVDLLRFRYLSTTITRLIRTEHLLPTTIGVFSDWGGGKSTLLKMVQAELDEDPDILCLTFNGWLFEGYEDAKSALMGTILEAIQDRAEQGRSLTSKGRDLLFKLLARVNWLQLASLAGRYVLPTIAGLPQLSLANAAQDIAQGLRGLPGTVAEKGLDPEEAKKLLNEAPGGAEDVRRNIRDFRADFAALLEEAGITTLVVFIDDLDRCLPDTIIETLEAIKLFLFVKGTAFVLGADERLVRYAVRRRFPELPGPETEVGRDYLEKLVQIPIKIPPLSGADIWSYMNLLFAQLSLDELTYGRICEAVATAQAVGVSEPAFTLEVARRLLDDAPIPPQLERDLDFAGQIAPVLIPGLAGNPRRTKRFLNTLMLRLQLGEDRGLDLQRRVMAKLMLLEYLKPEFFTQLARLQADQGGKPTDLATVEGSLRRAPGGPEGDGALDKRPPTDEGQARPARAAGKGRVPRSPDANVDTSSAEVGPWLADEWMVAWLASDPPLADADLRPYFYIAHDKVGALDGSRLRLTPAATEVLNRLLDTGQATRQLGLKEAMALSDPDATAVFEALAQRLRQAETLDAASPQKVLVDLARGRPDLIPQLVALYIALPETKLTAVTPVLLREATAGTPSEAAALETLRRWGASANAILAGAARAVIERQA